MLALAGCGVGTITVSNAPVNLKASTVVADQNDNIIADADQSVTVTITVLDSSGLPVRHQQVVLTVSGTDNTLSTPAPTDANGVTHFTLRSTRAETKTIAAAIVYNGQYIQLPNPAVVKFVSGPGVAMQFSTQPSDVTATFALTPPPQITVIDAYANATQDTGSAISLGLTGNPNVGLTGTLTQSTEAGTVAFPNLTVANANTYTFVATSAAYGTVTSTPFTVQPGPPVALGFAAVPTNGVAGQPLSAAVVHVQDAGGNLVRNAAGLVTLALGQNSSGATLTGVTQVNAAGGVATFNGLGLNKAGTFTLRASASGFQGGESSVFAVASAAPSIPNCSLLISPPQGVADGNSVTFVTLRVRDVNNNPVVSQTVSFQSSDSNDVFTPLSGNTNDIGTFTTSLTAKKAGTHTITGVIGSGHVSIPVSFAPGAPSGLTSTLAASPNQITAGGTSATINLLVRDINGNAVSGQSISISATGSSNLISPAVGVTDANGKFTSALYSTVAEDKIVSANVPTQRPAVVHVNPGPLDPNKSTLTASPNSLVADGTASTHIVFLASDAYHNGVGGQPVGLSVSGSNNTLSATTGTTGEDGTLQASLTSTHAESKVVTATQGTHTYHANLVFVPGPASDTTSTLQASSNSVVADGSTTTTLTVTALDAHNNVLSGVPVFFASTGGNNTFSATNPNTNGSGQAVVTLKSSKAESKQVSATFAGLTLDTTIAFTAGPPAPGNSTLVAYPKLAVLADGLTPANLALTLHDAGGNLIGNQAVTWTSTGAGTFAHASGTTHANGGLSTQVVSAVPGPQTITATYGSGLTSSVQVTFLGNPNCTGTPLLPSIPAVPTHSGTVSVAAGDFNGDNKVDLVAAWQNDNDIAVFLQDAQGVFHAPTPIAVGNAPSAVAVADFDNDLNLDIAVANANDNTVSLMLGAGNGTFGAATTTATSGGGVLLVAANFGGDALPDLAVLVQNANHVDVLLNTAGALGTAVSTTVQPQPTGMAVGQFDADPNNDLVVTSTVAGSVALLLGQGDGSLVAQPSISLPAGPGAVVVADFNGDNNADWMVAQSNDGNVALALGGGNGTFNPPTFIAADVGVMGLASADVNGDNRPDVVGSVYALGHADVLLNGPGAAFTAGAPALSGLGSGAILAVDINGDNRADTTVVNAIGNVISIGVGAGNGNFAAPPTQPAGGIMQFAWMADVNEDSQMDVVAISPVTSDVAVLLGNNDGTWRAPKVVSVGSPSGSGPQGLAWGDFDNDGHLDLAVALSNDNVLALLMGAGNGNFTAGVAVAGGNAPYDIATTDMDGDGNLDLISVQRTDGTVQINLGAGDGTFATGTVSAVGSTPQAVLTALFNNDAHPDVVAVNNGDNTVSLLLGVGNGTLQAATPVAVGNLPTHAIARDFNGDSATDLWVVNNGDDSISFLAGNNSGGFAAPTLVHVGVGPVAAASGDVNGDGKLDGLVLVQTSGAVAVVLGNGDGTFQTPLPYVVPADAPFGFAVGDLNSDGTVDVVSPRPATNAMTVLLGGACVP